MRLTVLLLCSLLVTALGYPAAHAETCFEGTVTIAGESYPIPVDAKPCTSEQPHGIVDCSLPVGDETVGVNILCAI